MCKSAIDIAMLGLMCKKPADAVSVSDASQAPCS